MSASRAVLDLGAVLDPDTGYKARDLATGRHYGSGKLHIISLRYRPYPEKTDQNKRADLWDASPLCGAYARYYWHTRAEKSDDDRCTRCFQRWRALGQPRLVNAPEPTPTPTDITLPWGWREVDPEGLEKDLNPAGDSVKRREVRRWVRGDRYVRICESVFEKEPPDERKTTHWLHTGWIGSPSSDKWRFGSDLPSLIHTARTYMMLGGNDRY